MNTAGQLENGSGAFDYPVLRCPDPWFERLWHYRWQVVRRHLKWVPEESGHVITEFNDDGPHPWAGVYNTIVAAVDHHIRETRWLPDPRYALSHLRILLHHPEAQPHNYSAALADAAWALCEVHPAVEPELLSWLDRLQADHAAWRQERVDYPFDQGYDAGRGLYWNTGRNSTGEYNLASAQLNEPLRGIHEYKVRGGAGYRPDCNTDRYANARALQRFCERAGRFDEAEAYGREAEELKEAVQRQLWDPQRQFFMHRWRYDEYSEADAHGAPSIRAGSRIWETNADRHGGVGHQPWEAGEGRGRELVGYLPWCAGLPDDTPEFARAWDFLMDPGYFHAPYGPTTAERHDPWFSVQYNCRTNGNSFPLNTSRVLRAAGNLLHDYRHTGAVTPQAYMDLLTIYVRTQMKEDEPYVAEFHHPDQPVWVVDRPISQHYFHSSFCDLVLTGLLGIRRQGSGAWSVRPLPGLPWTWWRVEGLPYEGRRCDIQFDVDGRKFGQARGLTITPNTEESERCTCPVESE